MAQTLFFPQAREMDPRICQRLPISDYMARVGRELQATVCLEKNCHLLVMDYFRPGFLVSRETLSDLCFLARTLLCDHEDESGLGCVCGNDREWTPDHFSKSRYKTREFQDYLKHHSNWEDDIGVHFAKKWNHRTLISDSHFILYQEDENKCIWKQCRGQTVAEVFGHWLDIFSSYWMDIQYIHIGVGGFPLVELSPTLEKPRWGVGFPDECCICELEPCGLDDDEAIKHDWLYCQVCQSGPYCSETCRMKCVQHQGFHQHTLTSACECGFQSKHMIKQT